MTIQDNEASFEIELPSTTQAVVFLKMVHGINLVADKIREETTNRIGKDILEILSITTTELIGKNEEFIAKELKEIINFILSASTDISDIFASQAINELKKMKKQ